MIFDLWILLKTGKWWFPVSRNKQYLVAMVAEVNLILTENTSTYRNNKYGEESYQKRVFSPRKEKVKRRK